MTPILYTSRECPFSIRARMALCYAGIRYEVREVEPGMFPADLNDIMPDTHVPVLLLGNTEVLSQSMEILHWALLESDPDGWIDFEVDELDEMNDLLHTCDESFATDLAKYHYPERFDDADPMQARSSCRLFLDGLEQRLHRHRFLFGERISYADIASYPLVRAFANVDRPWFDASSYIYLKSWLAYHENSPLFRQVMNEYPAWQTGDTPIVVSVDV